MNRSNYKTVVTLAAVFFCSLTAARAQKEFTPLPIPMPGPVIRMLPRAELGNPRADLAKPHADLVKPIQKPIKPGIYNLPPDNMPCVVPDLRNVARMPVQKNQPWLPQPK